MIKPFKLKAGDTVATVSLSWGGAGDEALKWRYEQGIQRLKEEFGLNVVEMPITLAGSDYVYHHPKERARDLMQAFLDPNIKAIFSCIGGEDSIRLLPYIDFNVLKKYPKIFIGYSDSTVTHLMLQKAGVVSFYGASILMEFAENVQMFDYTKEAVKKNLFEIEAPLDVLAPAYWSDEYLPWLIENKYKKRAVKPRTGYEVLQGEGIHEGILWGGCIEVLEFCKGTQLWPDVDTFEGKLIFFETSEEMPSPQQLVYFLRNYVAAGILQKSAGLLFGKPYQDVHYEAYKEAILKVVRTEAGLDKLPIFYNMPFGHTSPICVMPLGVKAQINCENATFTLMESGVIA